MKFRNAPDSAPASSTAPNTSPTGTQKAKARRCGLVSGLPAAHFSFSAAHQLQGHHQPDRRVRAALAEGVSSGVAASAGTFLEPARALKFAA